MPETIGFKISFSPCAVFARTPFKIILPARTDAIVETPAKKISAPIIFEDEKKFLDTMKIKILPSEIRFQIRFPSVCKCYFSPANFCKFQDKEARLTNKALLKEKWKLSAIEKLCPKSILFLNPFYFQYQQLFKLF